MEGDTTQWDGSIQRLKQRATNVSASWRSYLSTLESLSQDEVREAIREAVRRRGAA